MKGWQMNKPYKAEYGHDKKYYLDGPAPWGESSYHGGTLYTQLRFTTNEEATRAATIANIAYNEGYSKAQADIREALGLVR